MGCINSDGTMEPAVRALVLALRSPRTAEELAREVKYPLYRVRSGLRELSEHGLILQDGERYLLTATGKERATALARAPR